MKLKFWNSFPKLIVKPFSTAEGSIFLQSYGLIAIWWKHLEWNKIIANIILFALITSLFNELTLTIGRMCVFDWRSNYWQKPEFPDLNRSGWAILIEHAKYYLKDRVYGLGPSTISFFSWNFEDWFFFKTSPGSDQSAHIRDRLIEFWKIYI